MVEAGTSGNKQDTRCERLRQAGRLELFFESVERLNLTSWVVIAARYVNASGVNLDRAVIFPALEQVIRENAALSARVTPPPAPRVWVRLPSVDLNKVVEFIPDKSIDELSSFLEGFFAKPVEKQGDLPLWRLLVLRDGTIIFAYDHTMGDGQSGPAFHSLLLTSLNALHEGSPEPQLVHSGIIDLTTVSQDIALPPALEDAMDLSVPVSKILREAAHETLPLLHRKRKEAWTGHPVPKVAGFDVGIRILRYTPTEASSLVAISREHGTTLTGTLHTLALVLFSRLIQPRISSALAAPSSSTSGPQKPKRFKTVSTLIPISLRRYTGAPPTAICNQVSEYLDYHPLLSSDAGTTISRETFPWDTAAAFAEKLRSKVPRSGRHVGMLKYLFGRYDEYQLRRLGKQREAGLELSNLGPFPAQPAYPNGPPGASIGQSETRSVVWTIDETVFAQADVTLTAALKLSVTGTPPGGLAITLSWGKDAVDPGLAREFATGFEEGLRALVKPQ